jgi:hypothetical protein
MSQHSLSSKVSRAPISLSACSREPCCLEVLQWLHNAGGVLDTTTCSDARGGHLETLKWLHSTGCTWDLLNCAAAAEGGQLEVLQWLHNIGCPWRAPGGPEVCAGKPLRVGRDDVRKGR